jgi:hypothetical protein
MARLVPAVKRFWIDRLYAVLGLLDKHAPRGTNFGSATVQRLAPPPTLWHEATIAKPP